MSTRRLLNQLTFLLSPLALFLLWTYVTDAGIFPEQILVSPGAVADAFKEVWDSGELSAHLGKSLSRLGSGFVIGSTLGLAFGVLLALSRLVESLCAPLFQALRQVPAIAFIPMFILFFGIEESFKVVIVAQAAFFPVALAAYDSVKGVPRGYFEVAAVYKTPLWALIRRIILPATVPPVLTGLRISLTRAWVVLVAAELLAADSGIGQMMEMGRQMFRIDIVMVGVVLTGLIGFGLDHGFKFLERHLIRWRTQ